MQRVIDKGRHKEKGWLSQATYSQIANHKKLHVYNFLQLYNTTAPEET